MKRLTVLRHAKAVPGEPGLDDFDRPLDDRGRSDARAIGCELQRRGAVFDQVLASPARRVRETLDALAAGHGGPLDIAFDERLYLAPAASLLDRVRAIPRDVESLLLVGHNPGLQQLLVELGRDEPRGLRSRIAQAYPTAALAIVEFEGRDWAGVAAASGELVELILPRELD